MVTVIHFRLSAGGAGRAGPGPADVDAGPPKKKKTKKIKKIKQIYNCLRFWPPCSESLQLSPFSESGPRNVRHLYTLGTQTPKIVTVVHFGDSDAEDGDSYTIPGPRRQK